MLGTKYNKLFRGATVMIGKKEPFQKITSNKSMDQYYRETMLYRRIYSRTLAEKIQVEADYYASTGKNLSDYDE
jgi:hypothetical protein